MGSGAQRVFISCDLEGITGVVSREQTGPAGKDYESTRRMMTADVNAAIEGALAGGAGLVVVSDGHGSMRNLLLDELDPVAEAVVGSPKPLTQMEGIGGQFDVVFFVGYHARMGSSGVLSHTISGSAVANIWVNDVLMGETGLNAVLAGHFGVPVGLVTGDQCVCAEARELLGDVVTVEVKQAITRYAARCLHAKRSQALIREAAERATREAGRFSPLRVRLPVTYKIQFKDTGMADAAIRIPGAIVVDPTTLAYTGDDPATVFKAIRGMIGLAAS
jgi:D-amino peptidase